MMKTKKEEHNEMNTRTLGRGKKECEKARVKGHLKRKGKSEETIYRIEK